MGGMTFKEGATLDQLIKALQSYRRDDRCGAEHVTLFAHMCECNGEHCDPEWFEIENIKHSSGIEIRLKVM